MKIPVKFIGNLSRLKKEIKDIKWDTTILLLGPEPRRTNLEKKLIAKFSNSKKKILLIQGEIQPEQQWKKNKNVEVVNFMLSLELNAALNESRVVIVRSGYSSIMDLSLLGKKVVLIPIKGQDEQEYLANFLRTKYRINYLQENEIDKINFEELDFKSLPKSELNLESDLFDLFKCK